MKDVRSALRRGLVAAVLAAAATLGAAQNIPGIAARVNGVEISNFRLERHFEDYLKGQRRNISSMINPRVYKRLKKEALDQLIEREVLWQAARAEGVVADDEEVKVAIALLVEQLKGRDAYLRKITLAGFDEKGYHEYVRQDLSGTRFLMQRTASPPEPGDEDIASFYRQNLHRFQQPESARARHILVRIDRNATAEQLASARARAEGLLAELKAGADFAELARRHSGDVSAPEGGDLGEVVRGRKVKAFDDALFALEPGQTSGVVESPAGFHLIRRESRTEAVTQPLEVARDGIRARLIAERRVQLTRELKARLKDAAKTEVLLPLD